jgi:hypothetical protein
MRPAEYATLGLHRPALHPRPRFTNRRTRAEGQTAQGRPVPNTCCAAHGTLRPGMMCPLATAADAGEDYGLRSAVFPVRSDMTDRTQALSHLERG